MRAKATLAAGLAVVALLVLLGGCSTTPEAFDAKSLEAVSQNYAENYEEVYQRLTSIAGRCFAAGSINALRLEVQADLHKERDFGNVRFVAVGLYSNYFASARIEKLGTGSRVSVKSGSPLTSDRFYRMIFRWAGGDQEC